MIYHLAHLLCLLCHDRNCIFKWSLSYSTHSFKPPLFSLENNKKNKLEQIYNIYQLLCRRSTKKAARERTEIQPQPHVMTKLPASLTIPAPLSPSFCHPECSSCLCSLSKTHTCARTQSHTCAATDCCGEICCLYHPLSLSHTHTPLGEVQRDLEAAEMGPGLYICLFVFSVYMCGCM